MNFMLHGGVWQRQPDSVCYISYWHIPNGSDYDRAEIRSVYFSDRRVAEQLAAKYHNPPEMAMVIDLKEESK